jgi:hypothetical protein
MDLLKKELVSRLEVSNGDMVKVGAGAPPLPPGQQAA